MLARRGCSRVLLWTVQPLDDRRCVGELLQAHSGGVVRAVAFERARRRRSSARPARRAAARRDPTRRALLRRATRGAPECQESAGSHSPQCGRGDRCRAPSSARSATASVLVHPSRSSSCSDCLSAPRPDTDTDRRRHHRLSRRSQDHADKPPPETGRPSSMACTGVRKTTRSPCERLSFQPYIRGR